MLALFRVAWSKTTRRVWERMRSQRRMRMQESSQWTVRKNLSTFLSYSKKMEKLLFEMWQLTGVHSLVRFFSDLTPERTLHVRLVLPLSWKKKSGDVVARCQFAWLWSKCRCRFTHRWSPLPVRPIVKVITLLCNNVFSFSAKHQFKVSAQFEMNAVPRFNKVAAGKRAELQLPMIAWFQRRRWCRPTLTA